MRPWRTLESVNTAEGPVELRKRDAGDYLITVNGRVLMTSTAHESELALARLGCASIARRSNPRILLAGLGMGYTLRAALDVLPASASVVVAELSEAVVNWCRGELATLTNSAVADERVTIQIRDVAELISEGRQSYDAILLDLYEGPQSAEQGSNDPFYGTQALARTARALNSGGVFAVWGEERDVPFQQRLSKSGFEYRVEIVGSPRGRRHPVYICMR